jgi:hypothetical protein
MYPRRRSRLPRKWFKVWIEEWETGSIRVDMDSAERGFWLDMISLALKGRVEGLMCRDSKGKIGYTNQDLALKYGVPLVIVESTIAKRLKDESIIIHDNNVIEIVNIWKYQSKLDKNNGDKMPLTVEEKIQRQKQLAAEMAYKYPDVAIDAADRKISERKRNEGK